MSTLDLQKIEKRIKGKFNFITHKGVRCDEITLENIYQEVLQIAKESYLKGQEDKEKELTSNALMNGGPDYFGQARSELKQEEGKI